MALCVHCAYSLDVSPHFSVIIEKSLIAAVYNVIGQRTSCVC